MAPKPTRPVPSRNMLAGSGTALPVICPCTVVIPLFEAGGTRFNGLFVTEYVIPPIVIDVTVKLTTPVPELDALKLPLKVAEKLSLPAIGTVCVIVRLKVPDAPLKPVPETNVWKLPKLDPVGVLKLVDPRPVNVIISAFPAPPKVTEFVPLPAQPAQVKVPEVEKVTGSAFACDVPNTSIPIANAPIANAFNKLFIVELPVLFLSALSSTSLLSS